MTIVQNIKYDNSCICPYAEEITSMSIEGNNKGIKLLNQIASLNLITPLRYFECSTCHYWVSRLVPVNEKSSTGPCEIQPLKNEHQTKVWPTFPLKWSHGGIYHAFKYQHGSDDDLNHLHTTQVGVKFANIGHDPYLNLQSSH